MPPKCTSCNSLRLVTLTAKHSDMLTVEHNGQQRDGYNPYLDNLDSEGSDYLAFTYCLDCGTIQGEWPASSPDMG